MIRSPFRLEAELAAKTRECDDLKQDFARAQMETQEMYELLEGIRGRVERLTAENSSLREAVLAVKCYANQDNTPRDEGPPLEDANNLNDQLSHQLINAEGKWPHHAKSAEQLHDKIDELSGILVEKELTIAEQEGSITVLQNLCDGLRGKLREVEEALCDREKMLIHLHAVNDEMQEKFVRLERAFENQTGSVDTLQNVIDDLKEKLDASERKTADLSNSIKNMWKLNDDANWQMVDASLMFHELMKSRPLSEKDNVPIEHMGANEDLRATIKVLEARLCEKDQMIHEQFLSLEELKETNSIIWEQYKNDRRLECHSHDDSHIEIVTEGELRKCAN